MKKFLAKSQTVSSDAPMGKTRLRPLLAFAGLLLFVGLCVDVGNLHYKKKEQLQRTADAGTAAHNFSGTTGVQGRLPT
jgi:hypothetical protein